MPDSWLSFVGAGEYFALKIMQPGDCDESSSAGAKGKNTSLTQTADAVEILSLNDLVISLTEDVDDYLSKQYAVLDDKPAENPPKKHRQNIGGNGHINSKIQTHLDKMMTNLKYPPADTCCRVNLITSSLNEVVADLANHLKEENLNFSYFIKQHDKIDDLVVIRGENSHCPLGRENLDLVNAPRHISSTRREENELKLSASKKRQERGWPTTHRAVIVDRFCGEAVLRGANIFVKGIICADAGIWKGEEVAVSTTRSISMLISLLQKKYPSCIF